MSDGKQGWLAGSGALIGGIGTLIAALVAYMVYAHPHGNLGQQVFSVPVNTGTESQQVGGTTRHVKDAALNFEVKKCGIAPKLVSCTLTVVSPHYDRRLTIDSFYGTRLIDSDGDSFPITSESVRTTLERDQKFTFKLAFAVNKDVVLPLTIRMGGAIDNDRLDKGFEIK